MFVRNMDAKGNSGKLLELSGCNEFILYVEKDVTFGGGYGVQLTELCHPKFLS